MRPWHTLLLITLAGFAGACGDDPKPAQDTADTSDTTDTTDTSDTADTSDTSDASDSADDTDVPVDTTPGDTGDSSLAGTTLEGIAVTFPAALTLCTGWMEGASIDDELAHKVRVVVPARARGDLERASLAAAAVTGLEVQRGPFAGERWRPAAVTGQSVTRYELYPQEGYDTLSADIRYDLGDAGVLYESYGVTRSAEDRSDVAISEGGYEVSFSWGPAGSDSAHRLEACAMPDDYETAVAVLVAGDAALSATLLRFFGTRYYEISAGSYPVRLIASQVLLSDAPWRVFEATGFWAQTYAAQHHNWVETSRIDFARDLAGWQTVFQPLAAGLPILEGALAEVQLADVSGGQEPSVTLTRLAADGTPSEVTLPVASDWRRVDSPFLGRMLALQCQGGVVGAVGFYDHIAQLMFCPDAAAPQGKRLVGVVPVVWQMAPERAGELIDGAAITPLSGRPGWVVSIGAGKLVVEPQEGGAFISDVLDAAGQSVGSAWSELLPLTPQLRWDAPVDAQAEGIALRIERRWAAQGVGESAIYAVESMTLAWGEEAYTVDAWDRLAYVNTHHNWQDSLAATTEDGHVLNWKVSYDFESGAGLVHTVWVTGPGGEEVLAPTVVTPRDAGE